MLDIGTGGGIDCFSAGGFTQISVRDKAAPEDELAETAPQSGPARLFSAVITAKKYMESAEK